MLAQICDIAESLESDVTKYTVEDDTFGKNEVSVIRKADKNIICMPTQTNCNMGCTFCHLTGTTRPVKNLTADWISSTASLLITTEFMEQSDKTILISFMGVGEPLLNIKEVKGAMTILSKIYKKIRFALSTMLPNRLALGELAMWSVENATTVKVHLSVHGIKNRRALVPGGIAIHDAIECLKAYREATGSPIEYHYTLVRGVNDSVKELKHFYELVDCADSGVTVKFLTLSENNGCLASDRSKQDILDLFPSVTVEFYDPPGRDVGSSCGMFNKELYNVA